MNFRQKFKPLFFSIIFGILILLKFPLYPEIYGTITGKVLDEESGNGIKGVEVYIVNAGKYSDRTKTGDNGEFRILQIPPARYEIAFFPPSPYAWEMSKNEYKFITIERGKVLHILKKIKHGGVLELLVYDQKDSMPMEGVYVHIQGASLGLGRYIKDIYTDKDGKFRQDRLYPGKYELVLQKIGCGMKIFPGIEIFAKQTTYMEIPFNTSSSTKLTGRIRCKQTLKGLSDVLVSIYRLDKYGWSRSYTTEDGSYSMPDIEPGTYGVSIIGYKTVSGESKSFFISKKITIEQNKTSVANFTVDCSDDIIYKKKEEDI